MTTFSTAMLTSSSLARKNVITFLAIGWTLLIATLCLIRFSTLPGVKVPGADKYVHFIFHFVFILLWSGSRISFGNRHLRTLFLLSLSYGILIELLQETVTTTRQADIYDVMANTTGGLAAIFLLFFSRNRHLN